jgi:catechol 2,3-dioxygenase-like lactoylglutathione lyase family enzyme
MTITNLFHYGVLVTNLDEAIDRFGEVMGMTFNSPSDIHLQRLVETTEHPLNFRATYSKQGPPYMELIEATGEGLYAPGQGEGLHHLGLWDPSLALNKADYLEKKNLEVDAEILLPDGSTFAWYAKPKGAHGVRFEFIDEAARVDLEGWIKTGIAASGEFII